MMSKPAAKKVVAKKGVIPAAYKNGGEVKHGDAKQDKAMMTKVATQKVKEHEAAMHKGQKLKNGGMVKKSKAC